MNDDRWTLAEVHIGGPGSLLAPERWTLAEHGGLTMRDSRLERRKLRKRSPRRARKRRQRRAG